MGNSLVTDENIGSNGYSGAVLQASELVRGGIGLLYSIVQSQLRVVH
jgi:hypothetical protein